MKRLLIGCTWLALFPVLAVAQEPASSHIWERAAYGDIPGMTRVRIAGWNPAITTTFEDASPESSSIVINKAALSTPYCASTSQTADIAAGTGANTLTLNLVNTSFAEVTETLTLHASDGRTSVNLATSNVLGFNGASVATAGSGGGNAGVIDCGTGANTAGSAAVAYVTIPVFSETAIPAAGAGAANVAHVFQYIVPASYKLVCRNITIGSVFATQASGIMGVIDGSTNLGLVKRYWFGFSAQSASPSMDPGYITFPEKTYIKGKLAGATGTNTGPASLGMECLKIYDTWQNSPQGVF